MQKALLLLLLLQQTSDANVALLRARLNIIQRWDARVKRHDIRARRLYRHVFLTKRLRNSARLNDSLFIYSSYSSNLNTNLFSIKNRSIPFDHFIEIPKIALP